MGLIWKREKFGWRLKRKIKKEQYLENGSKSGNGDRIRTELNESKNRKRMKKRRKCIRINA